MNRSRTFMALLAALALPALQACGADSETSDGMDGAAPAAQETAAPSSNRVRITQPSDGATVDGPEVTVMLDVTGVEIVPAGDTTGGTGHHHLYLDADLTPADEPVPSVPGSIVHMGDGSASYTFTEVEPGEHRLIAVVADGVHVPLQPWVVDTVTFIVR